jgi:phosphopantothenoylcysteine decarboxylase/phosphopantothenate--cysteine ligase
MNKKTVAIGVCGGIAVYKVVDLVSKLVKENVNVKVIMTKNAEEFVTPLTFQTISQNRVYRDMFEEPRNWDIDHISISKEADLIVIIPATANIIGKTASGIADDFLSTAISAAHCPVSFVPAMNTKMLENPITQRNIECLKGLGYPFLDPETGSLACGDFGKGKLPDITLIKDFVLGLLHKNEDFKNIKILITAGPTIEPIDPVRFISNRSSGKMGIAIAKEAMERGADVTLIHGPVTIPIPEGIKAISVETALDMEKEVLNHFDDSHCIIKTAAVADFRPEVYQNNKIKKTKDYQIKLIKNPDILEKLGSIKGDKILVGFAAESNNVLEYAMDKLQRKNCDIIVANDITNPHGGFTIDTNVVSLLYMDGKIENLSKMTKKEVARELLTRIKDELLKKGVI